MSLSRQWNSENGSKSQHTANTQDSLTLASLAAAQIQAVPACHFVPHNSRLATTSSFASRRTYRCGYQVKNVKWLRESRLRQNQRESSALLLWMLHLFHMTMGTAQAKRCHAKHTKHTHASELQLVPHQKALGALAWASIDLCLNSLMTQNNTEGQIHWKRDSNLILPCFELAEVNHNTRSTLIGLVDHCNVFGLLTVENWEVHGRSRVVVSHGSMADAKGLVHSKGLVPIWAVNASEC